MATIDVVCKACGSTLIYKHGKAKSGKQGYRCKDCRHCFQVNYRYQANKLGVT